MGRFLDEDVVMDLFHQYAKMRDGEETLDYHDIEELLKGIGEEAHPQNIQKLFATADLDGNGLIDLEEFMENADTFLGDAPASIILVVGGPGSGKGRLSQRLEKECHVVHLSSGNLLRDEVAQKTSLGRQVQGIMARGELVSSAIMVALMKKRMRDHPGKRVLLDGFPRSLENAHDLVTLCGKPELALHLVCDDTILMERIMKRREQREDDNFETALDRIRTYHRYHSSTIEWLKEQHVPIVNLDCTGPPESVWEQLKAIGRLMRPAVKVRDTNGGGEADKDWSSDPTRSSVF